jgi:universal stress protein A
VSVSEPELVEASQTALDKLVEEQFSGYDKVVTKVFFGNPWPSICNYAKDNDIDLIIVTTHGRTGLSHVLIGSTAERIVQHAPCAVLTVKHAKKDFVNE